LRDLRRQKVGDQWIEWITADDAGGSGRAPVESADGSAIVSDGSARIGSTGAGANLSY